MSQIKDLVSEMSKKITLKNSAQEQLEFWWNRFLANDGPDAYNNFVRYEIECKLLDYEMEKLSDEYDRLKNIISTKSNNFYAITIGSAEKTNVTPCLDLWKRFVGSADCKDFVTADAYFERGDNGYIHIHALIEKTRKWSMSMSKLRKRYGKYKGKQHNFDIKRIKGLEIKKWGQYIKKDINKPWNKTHNNSLNFSKD
jgi:hypothetical protein